MGQYRYKARSKEDQKVTVGSIEATSEQDATKKLRAKGLLVLSVQSEIGKGLAIPGFNRVSSKDKILFARELAVMVKAGLPIVQALQAIADQTPNKTLHKTIESLVSEVKGGSSLSAAFAKHEKIFPPIFVSVTKIGEKSGKLEEVFERLADQLEKDEEIVSKIKGAMIYPAFVLTALIGVIILIMVYIIPQFKSLFDDVNVPLPLITRGLLAASDIVRRYLVLVLILIASLVIGIRIGSRIPKVNLWLENVRFKIPVFGNLFQKVIMTRFTNTLGTLLAAGLPMIEALETVGDVMGSSIYKQSLLKVKSSIENGQSLSEAISQDKRFPKMVSSMISIGENSGKIDESLSTVASFYNREVENLTRNLSALIEPFLMICMGLGVGLVVASVITPIYNLVGAV